MVESGVMGSMGRENQKKDRRQRAQDMDRRMEGRRAKEFVMGRRILVVEMPIRPCRFEKARNCPVSGVAAGAYSAPLPATGA